MVDVFHYGVHWADDGISYLHQGGEGENAVGIPDPSPFVVTQRRPCNHHIQLSDSSTVTIPDEVMSDPLVRALAPIPHLRQKIFFIEHEPLAWEAIGALCWMSNPIKTPVLPIWHRGKVDLKELEATNVQPLIVAQLTPKHGGIIKELAEVSYLMPRTILLVGNQDVVVPQPVIRIKTNLRRNDLRLPWRRGGAFMLKSYMRNQLTWRETG